MRIVIAGSSGYLGKPLMKALESVGEGHDLVRLVRHRPDEENEILWDPYKEALDPEVLDGVDAVVNLCGINVGGLRWNAAYKKRIETSRVIPTKVLAEAVAAAKVPVMVNASAAGWYGDRADVEVDESTPAAADFLGRLCLKWEAATAPAEESGTRVVRLRTGHVLGPESVLLDRFVPVVKCFLGGRFGNGRQYLPWISLRDWVGAAVTAIEDESVRRPNEHGRPQPGHEPRIHQSRWEQPSTARPLGSSPAGQSRSSPEKPQSSYCEARRSSRSPCRPTATSTRTRRCSRP